MAWTNPVTWAAAQLVDVTDFNEQIRDNLNYLLTPNAARRVSAAGNYTTTSTTYVSLGTAWALALNTYGGHVLIGAIGRVTAGASVNAYVGFDVDGAVSAVAQTVTNGMINATLLVTGLASGAHTLTLKWRSQSGDNIYMDVTNVPLNFWATEF